MKRIDILTLFPDFFDKFVDTSIIKRAIDKQIVQVNCVNIRDFSLDKNKRVDDYPTGGGAGMILQCQPVIDAIRSVKKENSKVYLLSASGKTFNQQMAHELANIDHLILVCGHYEGVDARILNEVDDEISIGDYILTGGEIPAMIVADATIRLLEGSISSDSTKEESFESGLLEYPQYTFPRVYEDNKIPDILFSGNHLAIKEWRFKQSYLKTLANRPDLIAKKIFTKQETKWIEELTNSSSETVAIKKAQKFMK